MRAPKTKRVRLDWQALAMVPHSGILAIEPSALDGSVSLAVDEPAEETSGTVAIVRVTGPLAQHAEASLCAYVDGYDAIEARFAAAIASGPDAILQIVNSPGGDAMGMVEAVDSMRAMAADAGIPVVTFCEYAASAGYGLATVGDEVLVSKSAMVGSVGTVMIHMDHTAALAEAGIKPTIIRSRANKYKGSSLEPLDAKTQDRMQTEVDAFDLMFAGLVLARRPGAAKAIEYLAGETAMAADAVRLGLADGIATLSQALDRAAKLGGQRRQHMKDEKQLEAANAVLEGRVSAAEGQAKALIEATGATGYAAALGKIEAGKDALAKLAAAETETAALRAEVEKRAKAAAVEAVLVAGADAGRVTLGNRDRLAAFGVRYGAEDLAAHVAELPVQAAAKTPTEPAERPGSGLTAEDRRVMKQLGISEQEIKAANAAEVSQ